ncbi:MAG: replicative DNA helicase [Kiritimatiellaeota bacterium]|nr:replicative DNA helicase [Kiritimatiellota bacterium]
MDDKNRNTNKQAGVPRMGDDRPPPHDYDLERSILGAILYEPESLEYALDILGSAAGYFERQPRDQQPPPPIFHRPAHQRIYSALCDLIAKDTNIDLVTLKNALQAKEQLEDVGGMEYLAELADSVATAANIEAWCVMLRDLSILRNLIHTCESVKEKCHSNNQSVEELLDEVERDILGIGSLNKKPSTQPLSQVIKNEEDGGAIQYLMRLINKDETVTGISTGFGELDKLITGLKPGEMFVLAARPSIGKTSFALNLMTNIALRAASNPEKQQKRCAVGFFSLEMTARQLAVRLICTESGFSEREMLDGKVTSVTRLTGAASKLAQAPIFIDPTPSLKVRELRSKARKMKSQHDIDIIFIDYLQLMKAETRSDNRQEEVSAISSGIKSLAKELNIPIVVLAQLNREVEKTHGEPRLSHLRESGAIEQDADVVAFLHRDKEKQKEMENSEQATMEGLEAKLIIEKNRNGSIGYIDLLFFPRLTKFTSKSRIDDADVPR